MMSSWSGSNRSSTTTTTINKPITQNRKSSIKKTTKSKSSPAKTTPIKKVNAIGRDLSHTQSPNRESRGSVGGLAQITSSVPTLPPAQASRFSTKNSIHQSLRTSPGLKSSSTNSMRLSFMSPSSPSPSSTLTPTSTTPDNKAVLMQLVNKGEAKIRELDEKLKTVTAKERKLRRGNDQEQQEQPDEFEPWQPQPYPGCETEKKESPGDTDPKHKQVAPDSDLSATDQIRLENLLTSTLGDIINDSSLETNSNLSPTLNQNDDEAYAVSESDQQRLQEIERSLLAFNSESTATTSSTTISSIIATTAAQEEDNHLTARLSEIDEKLMQLRQP